MSYLYSYNCLEDCPAEVIGLYNSQDEAGFCKLTSGGDSCVGDCEQAAFWNGHCVCDTGALFASYSYDFVADAYCCGTPECKDAVLDMYYILSDAEQADVTKNDLEKSFEKSCSEIQCTPFPPAPSPTAAFVDHSLSHSYSSYSFNCYEDCSADVLDVLNGQDEAGFCKLTAGGDSCVSDCEQAFWTNAHCVCDTGALFASYSYDFVADAYCCGTGECQAAVIDMFFTLSDAETTDATKPDLYQLFEKSCATVQCTPSPPAPSPTAGLTDHSHSHSYNSHSYNSPSPTIPPPPVHSPTMPPVHSPTMPPVHSPTMPPAPSPTMPPVHSPTAGFTDHSHSHSYSSHSYNSPSPTIPPPPAPSPTAGFIGHSHSHSYNSHSYNSYSFNCYEDCSADVLDVLNSQDEAGFCKLTAGGDSCLSDCEQASWLNAHCVCDTGALFASYSYDFVADAYCCGTPECKDAVLDMYLGQLKKEEQNLDKDDVLQLFEVGCAAVQCGDSAAPSPNPVAKPTAAPEVKPTSAPLPAPSPAPTHSPSSSAPPTPAFDDDAFSDHHGDGQYSMDFDMDACYEDCPRAVLRTLPRAGFEHGDAEAFCALDHAVKEGCLKDCGAAFAELSDMHCTCGLPARVFESSYSYGLDFGSTFCCSDQGGDCRESIVLASVAVSKLMEDGDGGMNGDGDAKTDDAELFGIFKEAFLDTCSEAVAEGTWGDFHCPASPAPSATFLPSTEPTVSPSEAPSSSPSTEPSSKPTVSPTEAPSGAPSNAPSAAPSELPTVRLTPSPSTKPVNTPSAVPLPAPTPRPTPQPSAVKVAGVVLGGDWSEKENGFHSVSEDGEVTSTFTVSLATAPLSNDVAVSFSSQRGKVVATPATVKFTYLNYLEPVVVTLTAVDDRIDQTGAFHQDEIDTRVTTSVDSYQACLKARRGKGACNQAVAYEGVQGPGMPVEVLDDDTAGVAIFTKESDDHGNHNATATYDNFGDALGFAVYSVALTSRPTSAVQVSVGGLTAWSKVVPSALAFTPENWDTPVEVAVRCGAPSSNRPVCADGTRFCPEISARTEVVAHSVGKSDDEGYNQLSSNSDGSGSTVPSVRVSVSVVYDFSDPPVAVSARFTDLLNALEVRFDKPVARTDLKGQFECSQVLPNLQDDSKAGSSLFGKHAKCAFTDATTLLVVTKQGATVVPGDEVALKDGVLMAARRPSSLKTLGSSFSVLAPLVPTVPSVILGASSRAVGRCDDLQLDGSASLGSGGRDMKYSFSVASVGGSDVRNITSVLSAANAANGGLGTFKATIPSDAMEPGSAFEVSLQANNFLGYADAAYSDTSSAGNLFKLGNPAPVIRIQGKNPVTSATHSSALQLQASAALPKMTCVPSSLANSKMSFQWTEVSGKLGLSSSDLSSSSKNPRVVNIKEELLAATETYTFQVVGFMDSNPSVNNSAVVEVVVGQQDLVAGIGGGEFRQVGRGSSFTLDGGGSNDPDEDASTPFAYAWTCAEMDTGVPCGLAGTVDLTSETLTVGASGLAIGTYTFTLVASKGSGLNSRVSPAALANVEVVAGQPPAISINALEKTKYNKADLLVGLSATVTSSLDLLSTEWSVSSDSDVSSVFSVKDAAVAVVPNQLSDVLVRLDRLTAGSTYTLALTATDADGTSAFSTLTLLMNTAPSSGSLTVTPPTGYALVTGFEFVALNWVDEDAPLRYLFGTAPLLLSAANNNGTAVVNEDVLYPFGAPGKDSSSSGNTLSVGEVGANYTMGCFTSVVDSFGAAGTSTYAVRVTQKPKSLAELQNISDAKTKEEIDSGNSDGAKQVMDATNKEISSSSSSSSSSSETGDERRRRSLLADSGAEALRASVMGNLWSTYAITAVTQADVASLLNVLVGVVDAPLEVTDAVASEALSFLTTILNDTLAAPGHVGVSETASLFVGTALTSLAATNALATTSGSSSLAHAASLVKVLSLLSACELDGGLTGASVTRASGMVSMYSYRSSATALLGGGTSVGTAASVSVGASVADFAAASSTPSLTGAALLDTRVTTLDLNPYSFALDAAGTSAAAGSRMDQSGGTSSGPLLLRSLLTLVELATEGSASPLVVSGLSPPVAITLPATVPFPEAPTVVRSKCSVDGSVVAIAGCPFTSADAHTCNFAAHGSGDKYFFDYTCPSVVPKCVWFDEASSAFSGAGCSVANANHTSDLVTCECTHLTAFALTGEETSSSMQVEATPSPTSSPTSVPFPEPTATPTSAPTPNPTSVPWPLPTSEPTPQPTPSPTASPSLQPTPSPSAPDTVAVAVSFVLAASSAHDSANDVTFKRKVSKALFSNLDTTTVQGFTVVSTQTSRRRLSLSSSPQLPRKKERRLATYDWAVSFTVVTPLSAVAYATTASDFSSKVNVRLASSASGDFLDTLKASLPEVTSSSVAPQTVFESRTQNPTASPNPAPTSQPTPAPSPAPVLPPTPATPASPTPDSGATPASPAATGTTPATTTDKGNGSKGADSASLNLIILLAVGGGLLLMCAAGGFKAWQMTQIQIGKAGQDNEDTEEIEMGQGGGDGRLSEFFAPNPMELTSARPSAKQRQESFTTNSTPVGESSLMGLASGGGSDTGGGGGPVIHSGDAAQSFAHSDDDTAADALFHAANSDDEEGSDGGDDDDDDDDVVVAALVGDASLTVPEKLTRLAAAKEDGSLTSDYVAAKRKVMLSKSSTSVGVSYAKLFDANAPGPKPRPSVTTATAATSEDVLGALVDGTTGESTHPPLQSRMSKKHVAEL